MNDAMEGHFSGAAPILTPIVEDEDEDCEPLSSTPKKRARRSRGGMTEFLTESEMDLLVDNEDKNGSTALGDFHRLTEFSYKREKMFVKAGMKHLINSDLFFSTMLLRKVFEYFLHLNFLIKQMHFFFANIFFCIIK